MQPESEQLDKTVLGLNPKSMTVSLLHVAVERTYPCLSFWERSNVNDFDRRIKQKIKTILVNIISLFIFLILIFILKYFFILILKKFKNLNFYHSFKNKKNISRHLKNVIIYNSFNFNINKDLNLLFMWFSVSFAFYHQEVNLPSRL